MESTQRGDVAAGRVYEEFEPTIESKQEPGADTLLVHLPGFKKEQLRVQVTSLGVLRISGERQLTDNRWIRFRKEIHILSNYDPNEITARYEKGILFVKQPKLIVPDADKLQEKELPQEKAQPPIVAPSKPEQKSSPSQEKVQPPTEIPKPQKLEGQPPSESATNSQKQPQEKPTSEQKPEEQKNGKTEGAANDDQKKPVKADATGIATTSKSDKPENLDDSSLDSTKMDKDKAATGLISATEKLSMESYKMAFIVTVMDMKKNPRKLVNLVLVILSVVVLGMYCRNAIRSLKKSEN